MNLDDLRVSEKQDLALAATAACVDRLKKLTRWSDPHDAALHAFLQSLLQNEERRFDELERAGIRRDRSGPGRLSQADRRRMLKEFFPSFYKPFGEGPMDREREMYLAECLEEESARFYREMADHATDPANEDLFLRLEREDDSFLQLVRDVLLGQGRGVAAGSAEELRSLARETHALSRKITTMRRP
jgi:hypothetical protein